MAQVIKRTHIGDSCVVWSLGDSIDTGTCKRILSAYQYSRKMLDHGIGVMDVVPSYTELAVYVDPLAADIKDIIRKIEEVLEQGAQAEYSDAKRVIFPVVYNGEHLNRVAMLNNLTVREVIHKHQAGDYMVAMIGFLPHFPYLIGLDPMLETPRLESPKKKVPAGSVAIGGAQTGIYPSESPGGWNLIGLTDPSLLKTLEPGDRVTFVEET